MYYAVHYAEIGLKGRNRPRFEQALRQRLERQLAPLAPVQISRRFGRLLVQLPDDADPARASQLLARVFGVAYFSRASVCPPDLESIAKLVLEFAAERDFESFGIRARRVEKTLPFRSSDLARELGTRVGAQSGARVDLDDPDLWIEIHALSTEAILLHEREPGPGGMPVGTGGRAVSMISGGIDSPVSSYRMMRRGLALSYVHFHSAPFTSTTSQDKVRDLVARLAVYQGRARLYLVPFAALQRKIVSDAPADPRIVLYRRFMIRVAETLAHKERALALVTGESLGQVSSQTLGNLDTINRAATLPVLRPLIDQDKAEIVAQAQRIGTFEVSIEPDEDCCSYLMPRSPATWTRPDELARIEADLDVSGLVASAVEDAKLEIIEPIS